MTDYKEGDRVKVTFEGVVVRADEHAIGVHTMPGKLVSSSARLRAGEAGVTIEKLRDPEPEWVNGDLIKCGGAIFSRCRDVWRSTSDDSIESHLLIANYWKAGKVEILYKADGGEREGGQAQTA